MKLTNRQALDILIDSLDDVDWVLRLCLYNSRNSKNEGPWKYYWPKINKQLKTIEYMWKYIS